MKLAAEMTSSTSISNWIKAIETALTQSSIYNYASLDLSLYFLYVIISLV